jgi:hypothetical protein
MALPKRFAIAATIGLPGVQGALGITLNEDICSPDKIGEVMAIARLRRF